MVRTPRGTRTLYADSVLDDVTMRLFFMMRVEGQVNIPVIKEERETGMKDFFCSKNVLTMKLNLFFLQLDLQLDLDTIKRKKN